VIVKQEANYLLAVKNNQPILRQAIQNYFEEANQANFEGYKIDYAETINKGHGRIEQRRCWISNDTQYISDNLPDWKELETMVIVESERTWGNNY
jgi:hypothetical protein